MAIKLKKYLKQWLVYWHKTGSNTSGQATFAAPAARRCRWDDRGVQTLTPDMRLITFNTHIMLDADVLEGSLIILVPREVTDAVTGDAAKATAALNWVKNTLRVQYPAVPTVKQGVREIKTVNRTGNKKARWFLFEVLL